MARAAFGVRCVQGQTQESKTTTQDFKKFRAERAPLLSRFACFETLRHKFNKPWWEWPEQWRQPDEAKCAALREGPDAAEIEFVEFVQWTADRQLQSCRNRASKLGMKVGLYLDVAVGVQSDGFDAWNEQVAISRHLAVGAPPDLLNTAGQNWGLAGFNAAGLEIKSFEPYREMLRASMRHAGAIRLDHVLGLKRLYLVPHGFAADNGVYVQMPFEPLLAATAQESVAHRCVVIGEDLGTVPEGFREQMAEWGIWSYQVMMFERDDQRRVSRHRLLHAECARHLQHPRSVDLCGLALVQRSCAEALARDRSRRKRRCAVACADDAVRRAASSRHRPSRPLCGRGFPGADQVPPADDIAGGSAGRDRPAQYSRHRERASELAAAAAACDRRRSHAAIDVAALKAATAERTRATA